MTGAVAIITPYCGCKRIPRRNVRTLRSDHVLMGTNTGSIELPELRARGLDSEDDWALAELKPERLFG